MARLFLLSVLFLFSFTSFSKTFDGYIIRYNTVLSSLSNYCEGKNKLRCKMLRRLNMEVVKEIPEDSHLRTDIEYLEPNWTYKALYTPEDEKYPSQWAPKKIKAEKAWDLTLGDKEITVAVIDTGVDYTHPDLKNQMWVNLKELYGKEGVDDDGNGFIDDIYGYDFANNDGDPIDDHNHGTHCAGIIGASHNKIGIAGVNANVRIMALKFLTASGSGSSAGAIASIKYAVDNGADILSNSWGGGGFSQALLEVIQYANDKGVIFVAAAGNESNNNDSKPTYPASYQVENVVSVASSDSSDNKSSFSNYGMTVHIAAPGGNILSTIRNGYAAYSGTSMACPHVAGAAALLLSENAYMSPKQIKERLLNTSDYLPNWEGLTYNAGRLNLWNMLLDIQPERPLPPEPDKWVKHSKVIETDHPYLDSKIYEYEIDVPKGSTYLRVHFSKFETESGYDKVYVIAGSRGLQYSGNLGKFYSSHINVGGLEKVVLKLVSDSSVNAYGFSVDFFEVQ